MQQFDEGLQVLQKNRLAEAAAVEIFLGIRDIPGCFAALGIQAFLTFWFGNVDNLHWVVGRFREVVRYPLNIYPFFIQAICTFLLPYAFINYFPSLLLFEKIGMTEGIVLFCCGIFVSALMVALPVWMFSRGLRRYESGNG